MKIITKNNINEIKEKKKKKTLMRIFHKKEDKYKIMLVRTDAEKIYVSIIDNGKDKQSIALSIEECSALRDVLDVFVKSSIMKKIKQQ